MPYAAAQSRALGRGRTRVFVGRAIPFYLVLTQSGMPFSRLSGTFGRSASHLPGLFWCLPTCTASAKTQKTHSRLHRRLAPPAASFKSPLSKLPRTARPHHSRAVTVRGSPDRALTTSRSFGSASTGRFPPSRHERSLTEPLRGRGYLPSRRWAGVGSRTSLQGMHSG